MGLDISAASHLRYLRPLPEDDEIERLHEEFDREYKFVEDVYFLVYPNNASFEQHLAGMKPGLYEYTEASKQHDFGAGPYSRYKWWRDQLARCAFGVPAEEVWKDSGRFEGRPFAELINFTDCDGCVGARVAAKLAEDFKAHSFEAEQFASQTENAAYWLDLYEDFAKAFALAAQGGALKFH